MSTPPVQFPSNPASPVPSDPKPSEPVRCAKRVSTSGLQAIHATLSTRLNYLSGIALPPTKVSRKQSLPPSSGSDLDNWSEYEKTYAPSTKQLLERKG